MTVNAGDAVRFWRRSLKEVVKGTVIRFVPDGSIRCEFVDGHGRRFCKTLAVKKVVAEEVRNSAEQSMRQNGLELKWVQHDVLRRDKGVVLAAVSGRGAMLKYASELLRGDKDVVLVAVREHGMALQCASRGLRKDKEVVLQAVRSTSPVHEDSEHGVALQYASMALRRDEEVVLAAVSQDVRALQYASTALWNNKEIVLAAVRQDVMVLGEVSEALRADQALMLSAIKQNPKALQFALEYHELSDADQRSVLRLLWCDPIVYPWDKQVDIRRHNRRCNSCMFQPCDAAMQKGAVSNCRKATN